MTSANQTIRLRFVSPSSMTAEDVEQIGAGLRAAGAHADVQAQNRFGGEALLVIAIAVALSKAADAVMDVVDRLKSIGGSTLDLRDRPAVFRPDPTLPYGTIVVIGADGNVQKTIDLRQSGRADLSALLEELASGKKSAAT